MNFLFFGDHFIFPPEGSFGSLREFIFKMIKLFNFYILFAFFCNEEDGKLPFLILKSVNGRVFIWVYLNDGPQKTTESALEKNKIV